MTLESSQPLQVAPEDREVHTRLETIAKMMAKKTGGTWIDFLDAAVKAVNDTPKNEVLHGEAPSAVLDSPEAVFMLMQDNARQMHYNAKLL